MAHFFDTFFYIPLYNGLIGLFDLVPWLDAGLVIILFTILIKLLLFPISKKSVRTQLLMKDIQADVDEIKKNSKGNKQQETIKIMALYKEKKINPFSGILLVLIQLPILFALYYIFFQGGLPKVDTSLLYSFIPTPDSISMKFLGFVDITQKNIIIAILAAVSQFYQIRLALPAIPKKIGTESNFKDELAKSMNTQMKYVMPVFVLIAAATLPAVISIYWTTSNLFMIGQELYIRRIYKKN
ncbi:MAG: YidC/Oxa1 family membrane protein insertase [bacterium]